MISIDSERNYDFIEKQRLLDRIDSMQTYMTHQTHKNRCIGYVSQSLSMFIVVHCRNIDGCCFFQKQASRGGKSLNSMGWNVDLVEGSGAQSVFKVRVAVPVNKLVLTYTVRNAQGQNPTT